MNNKVGNEVSHQHYTLLCTERKTSNKNVFFFNIHMNFPDNIHYSLYKFSACLVYFITFIDRFFFASFICPFIKFLFNENFILACHVIIV